MPKYPVARLGIIGLLLSLAISRTWAEEPRPLFQLSAKPGPHEFNESGSLLAREIARQSLLLAAREELGLATRDASLRESLLPGAPTLQTEGPTIVVGHLTPLNMNLSLASDNKPLPAVKIPMAAGIKGLRFDYDAEVASCEKFSRTQALDILKTTGLTGKSNAWLPSAPPPADTDERLGQWNLLSQFWLVQELHHQLWTDGESPERLSALSRAYAQMGYSARVLTGPEYAVFNARALLYAERLVAKTKSSPLALQTRAYARALAGLQRFAVEDLDTAAKAAAGAAEPSWVLLTRQFCMSQTDDLFATATDKGPDAGIAGQLAFISAQNMGVDGYRMNIALQVLQQEVPCDAIAISEFMCDHSGPGSLNFLVDAGPQVMAKYLPYYITKIPGMPPAATDAGKHAAASDKDPIFVEDAVAKALLAAPRDNAEPSWPALGNIVEEITYIHIWRHADLIKNKWGQSADDYVVAMLPLIKDHPLQQFVAEKSSEAADKTADFIDNQFATLDFSPASHKFVLYHKQELIDLFWPTMSWNSDFTALDYETTLDPTMYSHPNVQNIPPLQEVNPRSIVAFAANIEFDWEEAAATRGQWEPLIPKNPLIARAMALRAEKQKDLSDALSYARQWVANSPDLRSYTFLAGIYHTLGKIDDYRDTLKEFLDKGDAYGLEKQWAQRELAYSYMKVGDFQSAWPYAKDAADSGAAWGIDTASTCAEGLGQFDAAEALTRENAMHYDSQALQWYLWCRRLNRGNLDAARNYLQQQTAWKKDPYSLVGYDILESKDADVIALLQKNTAPLEDPWFGLHLALLEDAANQTAERDRILAATADMSIEDLGNRPGRVQMTALARLFQQCLQRNSTSPINERSVARFMKDAPGEESNLGYFIGRFLELHGRPDDAKIFYTQSVWSWNRRLINMSLSGVRLAALHVDPVATTRPASTSQPAQQQQQ